jgi:hypothetical protein
MSDSMIDLDGAASRGGDESSDVVNLTVATA